MEGGMTSLEIEQTVDMVRQVLASRPYFPCLLLVHSNVQTLEQTGALLATQTGWPVLPVGAGMAERLLTVSPQQRGGVAEQVLLDQTKDLRPGPLVCSELDLLFEPTLGLEPLALLRRCSRQVPLVALWPGTFAEGILAYAVPAHAHFRVWKHSELCERCILPL
jgi:hypothetical protein